MNPTTRSLVTCLPATLLLLTVAASARAQSMVQIKPKGDESRCLHRPTGGFDLAKCSATKTKPFFDSAGSKIAFDKECVAARADFLKDSALQAIPCPAVANERTKWRFDDGQVKDGFGQLLLTDRPGLCLSIIDGGATGTRAVLKDCKAFGVTTWRVDPAPAG